MVSVIRKIIQAPVVTGVKAYGEFPLINIMSITAIDVGEMQNDFGVEVLNSVLQGNETIVWTPNRCTINVQGGVSTITQVLAATVTGTPWGTIAAIAAGGTAVVAQALTAIRMMPDAVVGVAPSSIDLNLEKEGGKGFPVNPVLMFKHLFGGVVSLVLAQSNNNFNPSKAYGEKNKVSVTALLGGQVYNEYTVVMQNTVAAGSETIAWAKNSVTISKAATSTVAQVIAGVASGTAWGTVGKAASAALTDVSAGVVNAAISALDNFVGGADAGVLVSSGVSVQGEGEKNVSIDGRVFGTLRISALAATTPAELELNVVSNSMLS